MRLRGEDLTEALVADLTLAQLRSVDVGSRTLAAYPQQVAAPGSRILTLAELFDRYAAAHPTLWWTVEVKVDPTDPREVATREELTRRVIDAIKDAGVEGRSFVHSFDWAVLELARDIDQSLILSALMVPGMPVEDVRPWTGSLDPADFPDEVAAAAALGASVFSPYWTWCTPDNVARTHDLGLAVLPWTVNEVADLEAMKAAGVDGLVTIEDLIETVIGEIEDEHDEAEGALWKEEKPGVYVAQALTPLEEFEAAIGLRLRQDEDDSEIDTLGGLVFLRTGRVPARGEIVTHESGVEFEVIDADARRIKRLRVRLPGVAPAETPAAVAE